MELQEAILSRRTVNRFLPDRLSDAEIDAALDAGRWAQNHKLTQPWRFVVLGPETHRQMAENYAEFQAQAWGVSTGEAEREAAREKGRAKFMARPHAVAVCCVLSSDDQRQKEDYAATCCAIQNIQLAAWDRGIGMQWSTHGTTRDPATYRLLGLDPAQEEIVALLFFGKPAEVPKPTPRRPLDEVRRRLP